MNNNHLDLGQVDFIIRKLMLQTGQVFYVTNQYLTLGYLKNTN